MIRSAHIARLAARTTFMLLTLIATLFVVSSTRTASAATDIGAFTVYTTADLCKLTVTPKDASAPVGTQQAFTATLNNIGPDFLQADSVDATYSQTFAACAYKELEALQGVTVTFKVTSGPNAGTTAEAALDANGVATFSFTSAAAGVDVVEASLTLPDICHYQRDEQEPFAPVEIPAACANEFELPVIEGIEQCGNLQVAAVVDECPMVTLRDTGQVTWSAPAVVVQSADPSLAIASFKRCVSRQFKISPSYSGGTITSSTLFVDGRKKQTKHGSEPFKLSARSYKPGKHNFEVVTVFSSGKAASKFGSFTKCAARVTVKRVSPKFTG